MKFIKNKIVDLVLMEKENVNKVKENINKVKENVININVFKCNVHKELREKLKKREVKNKSKIRMEKYKRIKKMRGRPEFDDLENCLDVVEGIDESKIKICTEKTCGNKVMCFEYEGKIWKEGRKSMNYNRDYCVLDECKEVFGLEKIGMKRVLSNFRIEKIDKGKKSWVNNWHKVKDKKSVVYCVMDKVDPGIEIGKNKKMLKNREILKEFVKIGVFRGIFRVSDFNGRNVLIKDGNKLVSIDEGDIGKRFPGTDGLVTDLVNVPLAVFTADCLSIFLYAPDKEAIGIVHAGRKGTENRITVAAVKKLSADYGALRRGDHGIGACDRTGPVQYPVPGSR